MTNQAIVHVVDDDAALRDSLRWLIESVGLRAHVYGTAEEFLSDYDGSGPGCLVLDVRMPGLSGLELQEKLRRQDIQIPIIIVTGHADVPIAIRALKAGAMDFIEKPFSDQILLDRVRDAIERDREQRKLAAKRAAIAAQVAQLTPREREVMALVVAGKANKVIASELGLSQKTVEVHRARVMRKMHAESVAQLVQLALESPAPPQPSAH
jgi:RNA polymerase sigma factor (sigma-70 family)